MSKAASYSKKVRLMAGSVPSSHVRAIYPAFLVSSHRPKSGRLEIRLIQRFPKWGRVGADEMND